MTANFIYFSIFYSLFSGCIIYPPSEFVSAGITIRDVLGRWLGSENERFIQYQINRSVATLFVHSLLPIGYLVGLALFANVEVMLMVYGNLFWLIFAVCSLLLHSYTFHKILRWKIDDWSSHPIVKSLTNYTPIHGPDWKAVASLINTEYRRVDKVTIDTNSIVRVVVLDSWIIKVTPYRLYFANQDNSLLIINKTDTHNMSPVTRGEVQYINIKVNSLDHNRDGDQVSSTVEPFDIRLNALDFQDFQNKLIRPIIILQNVVFHKTLLDRFIDTFKEQIAQNVPYETDQDLEQCIGCMQEEANVKLFKQCEGGATAATSCVSCRCRPMWCVTCMAKWFASRQDESAPETWLSSKCTCPVCRSMFCVLDVSFVTKSIAIT